MRYTRNILFSVLFPYQCRSYVPAGDERTYRWISLLPDDGKPLPPEMVYVCRLSEAMARNQEAGSCLFVCIYDRYLSEADREDEELLKNIIIIEENRSITWVMNLLQNRFFELEMWETQMKDIVIQGGGYQDIFDVSERYLRNALFALDGTYRLIAYSKTYRSTDPINVKLYELGYHAPDVMEKLYKNDHIKPFQTVDRPTVVPAGTVSEFETINQWCRYKGTPLVHIVEVFSCEPMAADSLELFQLMMRYLKICLRQEVEKNQGTAQYYTHFMQDLIYGDLTDEGQIAECARKAGISESGRFDAYRICFRDNSKVLVGRFSDTLQAMLPESRVLAVNYEISVLNSYNSSSPPPQNRLLQILPLLEQYDAVCGVSATFSTLGDMRHACFQADYAIRLGQSIPPYLLADGMRKNVFSFQEVFLHCLLELGKNGQFDVFHNNTYLQKLDTLRQYDQAHGSDLAGILYLYLYCERRATEAGSRLHMHRNTVMYHVQKSLELIEVDLDDYLTRLCLMLAFHHLEMEEGLNAITSPSGLPGLAETVP